MLIKISCGVFFIFLIVSSLFCLLRKGPGALEVHFLDVGQGDAIYIRTPSGKDMLIDGGPSRIVLQRLSEAMPFYDRDIDIVLATHPDIDHIGGLPDVLERYKVGLFLISGIRYDSATGEEIKKIRYEKNIPEEIAKSGMAVDFGDGAHFDVLFPDTDVSSSTDTNETSITGKLVYGSTSVMLSGDLPQREEDHLASLYGPELHSDILKAGHHGSRTSSSERFLGSVSPSLAVISAGKKNKYGHPHKEVIDLFARLGIDIKKTWESRLLFVSDGKRFEFK